MRYAILSDVHGNLEALQAVLEDWGQGPILCLGDVIGYGGDPRACIDLIRSRADLCLMGNHEYVHLDWSHIKTFNTLARQSAEFTKQQLNASDLAWIRTLPFEAEFSGMILSHGSPYFPRGFHYLSSKHTRSVYLALSFTKMARSSLHVAFIGHTHVAGYFSTNPRGTTYSPLDSNDIISLAPDIKYILNCGSVGQPRNQISNAQYLVFDDETQVVEKRSIPYNVSLTVQKIRNAKLPDMLWQRIIEGN